MRGSRGGVILSVVAICLVAMLVGCSEQPVGAAIADTPRNAWNSSEPVTVIYDNRDTLTTCDLHIVARIEGDNRQQLIGLSVECQSPTGTRWTGDVTLTPSQEHRGGSFVEHSARWIAGARLPHEGEYRFTLTPTEECYGVWSVGVALKEQQ